MFIVSVKYIKPLDEIDSLLDEHIEFLKEQYGKNIFIASGRKVPRTGGIIIAKSESTAKLSEVLEQDPFYKNGAAEYEITEFVPSMTLPEFSSIKEV